MKLTARLTILGVLALVSASHLTAQDEGIAIRGGIVYPVSRAPIVDGVVLIRGGKFEQVGSPDEVKIPAGYRIIDAAGGHVVPGFIDLHNHTAASDLQDNLFQVNPEFRVLDNVDWDTPETRIAVAGGVTTVLTIPGSGTNMTGFGVVLKTFGNSPEEVVVRFPGALKIAQAGNPERSGGDLGAGRIGMNWMIRNVLLEGKAYHDAWTRFEKGEAKAAPPKDPRYENMRPLFRGEVPVAVHTQIFQVVQSTLRILHDELGLKVVLDHGEFDGFVNAPEFNKRGIPGAFGPRGFYYDQQQSKFIGLSAAWRWLGMPDSKIGLNTDAPVCPQEELPYQGTMAIRHGLPEPVALAGLTLNAAKMLMLDQRLGSLEVGKDADVAIWTGSPFDPRSRTRVVLVNGKVAYDSDRDGIRF